VEVLLVIFLALWLQHT